jgi:chemotaxis signal transduction protein
MEHLTETVRFNEEDFSDSGVSLKGDPYLGKVTMDGDSIVQLINIRKIISEEVCEVLFE